MLVVIGVAVLRMRNLFGVVILTGIYTIFGGLRAVLYTDMIQMFVLIGGAIAVTAAGLHALGGWGEMVRTAGPGFLDMWKPASDPNFPWTGILFGAPILGVWYWCTDQFIVQRTLAAHNEDHARRGTIFAGYLKILPLFIFVVPGVVAYALLAASTLWGLGLSTRLHGKRPPRPWMWARGSPHRLDLFWASCVQCRR